MSNKNIRLSKKRRASGANDSLNIPHTGNEGLLFPSHLHRIIELFRHGFSTSKAPNFTDLESLSITVHEVMSARWRRYHTANHIFSIAQNANPIQTLALLFHDLVYLHVDRRIHPRIINLLPEFYSSRYDSITVPRLESPVTNWSVYLVRRIFGFKLGQTLTPTSGANEFLSALVATRILEGILDKWDIIRIVGCIEATIAFRPKNEKGETPLDTLIKRISKVTEELGIKKSSRDFHLLALEIQDLANRDVSGFAFSDTRTFLTQTWELILEGNPIFKSPIHSIGDYRSALLRIEKFFLHLDPGSIFSYRSNSIPGEKEGTEKKFLAKQKVKQKDKQKKERNSENKGENGKDSEAKIKNLVDSAIHNLGVAIDYVQAKLLSTCILESIAYLTGGDAPMILFLGENSDTPFKIEGLLSTSLKEIPQTKLNSTVYELLKNGLNSGSDFDSKSSVIAAYIYPRIPSQERKQHLERAREVFEGDRAPFEFLTYFKNDLIFSILGALIQVAWTRNRPLNELQRHFSQKKISPTGAARGGKGNAS